MNDILNLLGLIFKAKKMLLGEQILKNFKSVKILILAKDISSSSRLRFEKKCHYYHVDIVDIFDTNQLSIALGKKTIKAIGITDEGFKKTLLKKLKEGNHGETDL